MNLWTSGLGLKILLKSNKNHKSQKKTTEKWMEQRKKRRIVHIENKSVRNNLRITDNTLMFHEHWHEQQHDKCSFWMWYSAFVLDFDFNCTLNGSSVFNGVSSLCFLCEYVWECGVYDDVCWSMCLFHSLISVSFDFCSSSLNLVFERFYW